MTATNITIQSSFSCGYVVASLHSALNQMRLVYELATNAEKLPEDIGDAITDIVANALSKAEEYDFDTLLARYGDDVLEDDDSAGA